MMELAIILVLLAFALVPPLRDVAGTVLRAFFVMLLGHGARDPFD